MVRHVVRATLLLALFGASTGLSVPAAAQTPEGTTEHAAAIARPALFYTEQYFTAWVRVPPGSQLNFEGYVNDGNPFEWATRCSAFAVNPNGYIVTAGHCVDLGEEGARATALEFATQWLADNGWIFPEDYDFWLDEGHLLWGVEGTERGSEPDFEMFVQRGVVAGGLQTGQGLPARVIAYQPWSEGDVAIVKIEEANLPTVLVAASADVSIGTEVLSIGYPGSRDAVTDANLEPTFKDGQINSQATREGGLLPVYEMSAALSGGMSGGPTVNLNGEVVGVNSFNISGETEAFNFITPASLVTEMLAQNGVANELGPIDQTYRAGLDAYFTGDYQTALTNFQQVLSLSPTHQQAEEYRQNAATALSQNPPAATGATGGATGATAPAPPQPNVVVPAAEEGGFPTVIVLLVALGVAVVGGLFFVALRRRPAPVAPGTYAPAPTTAAPQPEQAPLRAVPDAGFCPNCGTQVAPGTRFCPNCGHQIEAA